MLPPSSSSDEGPALRERDFDGPAANHARYPQERMCGGNERDGGNGRGRYSDDEEEETEATTAPTRVAGNDDRDGNDGDASPSEEGPPQASLDRALSHSELEELGFAAHLLLKISSSPSKRARVDLVSFGNPSISFFTRRERASPLVLPFFFAAERRPKTTSIGNFFE